MRKYIEGITARFERNHAAVTNRELMEVAFTLHREVPQLASKDWSKFAGHGYWSALRWQSEVQEEIGKRLVWWLFGDPNVKTEQSSKDKPASHSPRRGAKSRRAGTRAAQPARSARSEGSNR